MSAGEAPQRLRRAGLRQARSNVTEGQRVQLPPGSVMDFFGAELRAHFVKKGEGDADLPNAEHG